MGDLVREQSVKKVKFIVEGAPQAFNTPTESTTGTPASVRTSRIVLPPPKTSC